jgi:hypothetical protein
MSNEIKFTLGDNRFLDLIVSRKPSADEDEEPVDLDAEEPELRFVFSGKRGSTTYTFERDNLSGDGGIEVTDGPTGAIAIDLAPKDDETIPTMTKDQFITLKLELQMVTEAHGLETIQLDIEKLAGLGRMIQPEPEP